ncbi:MAG: FAD-dependent oxidoreductase [Desulfobacteraceae bacterium]|nr:FAD-dependent oxidoreductase [Desulfobacteraceae bacterium]
MKTNTDIIIIGGGIIGLACAHYLAQKGAKVKIMEKDEIGAGASHGNCGLLHFSGVIPLCAPGVIKHEIIRMATRTSPLHIKPRADFSFLIWLLKFANKCNPNHMESASNAKEKILKYSLALFNELLSGDELDCDFEKKGILMVFKKGKNFKKYEVTNSFLKNFSFDATKISGRQLQELEPALRKDIAGAWHNTTDWHLKPEMLVESWKKALLEKGIHVEENCRMKGFDISGSTIKGVRTSKGTYTADTFIMATGAWTSELVNQLKLNLPVQPGKGYSITMERPENCPSIPCLLYERNMVATPWKSGYRLGGTMEFSGFNQELNNARLKKILNGANQYLKTPIGTPVVEEWAGLRPMTFDDLPIIDWAPFQKNLIIATGHGMLGLTMATGTGKAVCDMIYGKAPEIDIKPFSISRF